MPFMTFPERYGRELGLIKGLLKGIHVALRIKFGAAALALLPEIEKCQDSEKLRAVLYAIPTATTLDDFRKALD